MTAHADSGPTREQLAALVERACRHLTPQEAARLRAGVARLAEAAGVESVSGRLSASERCAHPEPHPTPRRPSETASSREMRS